ADGLTRGQTATLRSRSDRRRLHGKALHQSLQLRQRTRGRGSKMAVRPEDRIEVAICRKVGWEYQQNDRFLLNVHRRDWARQAFAIPECGVAPRRIFKGRLDEVRERLRCRRRLELLEVRVGLTRWSPLGGRKAFPWEP